MVNHSKNFNNKKYNKIINLINKFEDIHVEISTIMNLINKFTTLGKFISQIKEVKLKLIDNIF